MDDLELFQACLRGPWETSGVDTQWRFLKGENALIFCGSNSKADWKANFAFPVVPYKKTPVRWYAHGGFVRRWKSARDDVFAWVNNLRDPNRVLVIAGYSHGAALATLAHEDFTFNGVATETTTFGAPRVLWMPGKKVRGRFRGVKVVSVRGDIVTHVPFAWMGYRHPVSKVKLGKFSLWSVKKHLWDTYVAELQEG